jgi:hypothetical protein
MPDSVTLVKYEAVVAAALSLIEAHGSRNAEHEGLTLNEQAALAMLRTRVDELAEVGHYLATR